MTILDIDMGNTRTKWRCGDNAGALPSPRLPTPANRPARVRVATVLRNESALAEQLYERFGVEAEFAHVRREVDGLVCGYRDLARLGVDRWLATLAAWRAARGPLVVVCAGTACTVDFVTADGRHQGGYIAPGLRLLREVLPQRTADIHMCDSAQPDALAPGVDTPSAVCAGTAAMLVGYVETAIAEFRGRHEASVFVTGGDADVVLDRLSARPHSHGDAGPSARWRLRRTPALVLDGLAIALP